MDTLNYLLLVNIYLVLFYVFYAILLKDETFFKLNRIYLVGGASLSFMIPFLQSEWIRSLFITKQVEAVTQNISLTFSNEAIIIPKEQGLEAGEIVLFIYLAGAMLGLLRFLWQLYKVQSLLKSEDTDHAFSFFRKVKVGKKVQNHDTIYDHELVHARQWHSADVILFEIISIINWFNPVVYLYRKAIKHIHEFTADEVASQREESKSAYAMILLSKTFGIPTHQLTNSFYNQSLLKQRIMMLHKSKSTRNALLKYGLSAPLFAAMMILSSASFKSEKVAERISNVSLGALEMMQPDTIKASKYEEFLKRNSGVKALEWSSDSKVVVVLKSGRKEGYDLNNPVELKKAESSYGTFPISPPPPPPVPMSEKNTLQVSKGQDGQVFSQVEISPEFPGGMKAFYEYLSKNLRYSDEARKNNISGKVILQFIVEKDGELTDVKILRGLGSGLDEEAVRVLAESPNWKPGQQNGRLVRVAYTLPISFNTKAKPDSLDNRMGITGANPDLLYVVDGREMSASGFKSAVKPNMIQSINVLKGDQAAQKYGEKGKAGVLEITTKAANSEIREVVLNKGDHTFATASSDQLPAKALYIIDGKKYNVKEGTEKLKSISPNDIETINVIKGERALKEFGEQGKEGVIQITLKKK